MDKIKVIRFSYVVLSIIILIGVLIYYIRPQTVWAGAGLSAGMMSFAALLHLKFRNPNQDKSIESKFTWLLLLCLIIGVALIFIYKSLGAADFYVGIGGGIAFVSAITYCIELLLRFVEGIR